MAGALIDSTMNSIDLVINMAGRSLEERVQLEVLADDRLKLTEHTDAVWPYLALKQCVFNCISSNSLPRSFLKCSV